MTYLHDLLGDHNLKWGFEKDILVQHSLKVELSKHHRGRSQRTGVYHEHIHFGSPHVLHEGKVKPVSVQIYVGG